MAEQWPKILSRRIVDVSPWVKIIARDVKFSQDAPMETYHAVGQQDYVAIVARRPDGKILIVRQFRPAVEAFMWELPAGLLDKGEQPVECCQRELLEETGHPARAIHLLGSAAPCTGRLSNRIHSFFVGTGEPVADFQPEPGIDVAAKSPAELVALINAGEFAQQLHLGALLLAELRGLVQLPR
jgi:8-oxo-dGTP pyrophosphatase MutT (NUDIX family)